jgi:hypothetical protein
MRHLLLVILLTCFPILTQGQIEQKSSESKGKNISDNPYENFRNKAFSVKSSDLLLNLPVNKKTVYGVIIDWSTGENLVTIVTFTTGDASVYLRSGQIYIGGFAHETISEPSKTTVKIAQSLIDQTQISIGHEFPKPNCVKIYFLTNNGTYVYQDTYQKIKEQNNKWTELFSMGNLIITEYRKLSEKK